MLVCKQCKQLVAKDKAYRTGLQSFCNIEHYKKYVYDKKVVKPKKNNWDKIRKTVLAADGNCCRVCGKNQNLHVHHIMYRSEAGSDDLSNLVTLCLEHHDLIHSDKRYYQEQCKLIVELRALGNNKTRIKLKGK